MFPKGHKAKPDNEKTDADWEIHEAITDWQQAAFNKHWYECSKFLDASEGGKQTSNDLHLLCQGYALAAARITELETALAEAEGRVIAEVVAWLRHPNTTMKHMDLWIVRTKAGNIKSQSLKDIGVAGWFAREAATALETGEWKK